MRTRTVRKPGSHIPPTYLRRSRRLQLTTFGNLFQWVPGASAMDHRHTQICGKCKSNSYSVQFSTCKYGSKSSYCSMLRPQMLFMQNAFIADNRWLACKVELGSTLHASWQSMPGTDYDLAINIHFCQNSVAGHASGCPKYVRGTWEPGFTYKYCEFSAKF